MTSTMTSPTERSLAAAPGRPTDRHSFAPLLVLLVHTKQELSYSTGAFGAPVDV